MIALGHQLRADDDVDHPRLHRLDELGGAGGAPQRVAGDDGGARIGPARLHLVRYPLDAGTAGDEGVFILALGALARRRHDVAAMVAGQSPVQPMFDHPCRAIRALETMAAGTAQGERRIASPVEEQQRLLAPLKPFGDGGDQRRREPCAAIGRLVAQVDGVDRRQGGPTVARRQLDFFVAPRLHLRPTFDGRCGARQYHRHIGEFRPHHSDIARMIMDAILLLEARLMRLVDDDQAQIGIGQEQRRACADGYGGGPVGDGAPVGAALRLPEAGMPRDRRYAEARREPPQHRFGQGDFGEQDHHLLAAADRLRHRLEIDFGLARSGHTVEQERLEASADGIAQFARRGGLLFAQLRWCKIRVGRWWRLVGGERHRFQRACMDQPAQHRVGYAGQRSEIGYAALPLTDSLQRLRPLRSHARWSGAGRPIFDDRSPAITQRDRWHHHPQHRAGCAEIIVGGPFDQPAQILGDRRQWIDGQHLTQPVVADTLAGHRRAVAARFPHRTQHPARAERHLYQTTRRRIDAIRQFVIERPERRVGEEDADAGGHAANIGAGAGGGEGLLGQSDSQAGDGLCRDRMAERNFAALCIGRPLGCPMLVGDAGLGVQDPIFGNPPARVNLGFFAKVSALGGISDLDHQSYRTSGKNAVAIRIVGQKNIRLRNIVRTRANGSLGHGTQGRSNVTQTIAHRVVQIGLDHGMSPVLRVHEVNLSIEQLGLVIGIECTIGFEQQKIIC